MQKRTVAVLVSVAAVTAAGLMTAMQDRPVRQRPAGDRMVAEEQDPRLLNVQATGTVMAEPDTVIVTFRSTTYGQTPQAASSANAEQTNRIVEALQKAIGEEGRVSTTSYWVSPEYAERDQRRLGETAREIVRYAAHATIEVKSPSLDRASEFISTGINAGATELAGIGFTLDNRQQARDEAIRKATGQAESDARTLAGAVGVGLGRIHEITLDPSEDFYPGPAPMMRSMAMEQDVAPEMRPEPIEVRATVRIAYEISQR